MAWVCLPNTSGEFLSLKTWSIKKLTQICQCAVFKSEVVISIVTMYVNLQGRNLHPHCYSTVAPQKVHVVQEHHHLMSPHRNKELMHFPPAFLPYKLYEGKAKIWSSAGTELAVAILEAIFKITHSMVSLRKPFSLMLWAKNKKLCNKCQSAHIKNHLISNKILKIII